MQKIMLTIIVGMIIIALIRWLKKREQERSERLAQVARRMGFYFQSSPESNYHSQFSQFQLFTEGHSKKVKTS